MKLAAFAASAGLAGAAIACADSTSPSEGQQLTSANIVSEQLAGSHTVRARVVGVDSAAGGYEHLVPIAGADVAIYLVSKAGAPVPDTTTSGTGSNVPIVPIFAGKRTTDADGRIALDDVAPGFYSLHVTAPANSPFRDGISGTTSIAPGDGAVATVYLYRGLR